MTKTSQNNNLNYINFLKNFYEYHTEKLKYRDRTCLILNLLPWWIYCYCFCRAWICNCSNRPFLWAHYLFSLTKTCNFTVSNLIFLWTLPVESGVVDCLRPFFSGVVDCLLDPLLASMLNLRVSCANFSISGSLGS